MAKGDGTYGRLLSRLARLHLLATDDWHPGIGDPNQANALCDRLTQNAHRIELQGPSLRKTEPDSSESSQKGAR